MVGVVASIATSVALAVGRPLPLIAVQFTPLLMLRKMPLPVAANRRAGVPGVTSRRLKRVPAKVAVASSAHGVVAPPLVVLSTPLP